MGLAFAFGWTPCIGPILAAILAIAASEATAARGAGLLAIYSLGLGIPFLLAAAALGPFLGFLKKFKAHFGAVERVVGVLLIATGIAFLTGTMQNLSLLADSDVPRPRQNRVNYWVASSPYSS